MSSVPARLLRPVAVRLGVVALLAASTVAAIGAPAGAKSGSKALELTSTKATGFSGILAAGSLGTLYVLSVEHAGALHCKGACLKTWKPLLVATSVKKVTEGGGVKGKVGFVARTSSEKQVTYNGYPIYTYAGDKSATAVKGEAVDADGGRWYLVHASATTNKATPFLPELQTDNIKAYSDILEAGSSSYSLYLLSNEKGGQLHCTSTTCLSAWPPLLVPTSTTAVGLGAGVDGAIGFVARSSTEKQVTFNTYPVYTFAGDTGPNESNGEGISSDGGTWYLIDAGATSAASTPIT